MIGRVIASDRCGAMIISTTYHPRHNIYLTRAFGGQLGAWGEWTQAETAEDATTNHRRFRAWAARYVTA